MKDIIVSSFDELTDEFLIEFRDNQKLDIEKFNLVSKYVFDLQSANISPDQHSLISFKLGELSFTTVHLVSCHYNKNDVYKISNFGDDDDRQIHNILYYVSNWFSYKKPIEEKYTVFGSW